MLMHMLLSKIFWLKRLVLRDIDKDQLLNGAWLMDRHINAANKLLQKQHPHQNGLQDSIVLASELEWESNRTNFVQVINVCEQHWVCASNLRCPENVVEVYDSIPAYSTGSTTLKKQIAVIVRTKSSSFTLRFVEVQRQSGGGDCALFAVANAVTLCNGQDPHLVRYHQTQMRKHLCDCFQEGKLIPFPEREKPRGMRRRISSTREVKVYCTCRLPHSSGKMIQCHTCNEWGHNDCKPDIPKAFWLTTEKLWSCENCLV